MLTLTFVNERSNYAEAVPQQFHSAEEALAELGNLLSLERYQDFTHFHLTPELDTHLVVQFGKDYCIIVETQWFTIAGDQIGYYDYPSYPLCPNMDQLEDIPF